MPSANATTPPAIRVVQVSTTDERGGAARAALRLHRELRANGLLSQMIVAQRFGDEPGVLEFNPFSPGPSILGRAYFRLGRRLHRPSIGKAGSFFSSDWGVAGASLASKIPAAEVVNLHWVRCLRSPRVTHSSGRSMT
jgi:hypothetical protein